jgi:dissimilatory sulfite reductase (desulfoviridin) alpha/beta subunit
MEYQKILKNNIENKLIHKTCEKEGHELDEIRIIYKRCKKCGKFVVVGDPEWLEKHGVEGRG